MEMAFICEPHENDNKYFICFFSFSESIRPTQNDAKS